MTEQYNSMKVCQKMWQVDDDSSSDNSSGNDDDILEGPVAWSF